MAPPPTRRTVQIELQDVATRDDLRIFLEGLLRPLMDLKQQLAENYQSEAEKLFRRITELTRGLESEIEQLQQSNTAANARRADELASLRNELLQALDHVREEIPNLSALEAAVKELQTAEPESNFAEDIRNKLELLEGDERLDASAIRGLEDLIKTHTGDQGAQAPFGPSGRDLISDYDLSDQLDGVTKTFNIPAVWSIISVDLSSFPHALRKGVDYTYTPTSITFTSQIDAATTLAAGQTCILTIVSS